MTMQSLAALALSSLLVIVLVETNTANAHDRSQRRGEGFAAFVSVGLD
jgi:hypothetical protein